MDLRIFWLEDPCRVIGEEGLWGVLIVRSLGICDIVVEMEIGLVLGIRKIAVQQTR
jgi:hypothetical protein